MTARAFAVLAAVVALAAPSFAQNVRLEFAARPRLVDCDGPCFRMDVTAVDPQGQPVAMDERAALTVLQNDQPVKVVSSQVLKVAASAGDAGASAQAPSRRVALVLFDTSGSMNERLTGGETKFTVAKRQLEQLLGTFQDGVDRMAIAPFNSRRVAERIRAAQFENTKAGIRRQIAALQAPAGNTALFSAVFEGLQVLKPFVQEDGQVSLVVFTDGKNDVKNPTDDPGLLDGNEGLKTVSGLAEEVGAAIYTIGYGAPGVAFDEASLQALKYPTQSTNYFNAQSEARLTQIFTAIARRSGTGVRFLVHALQSRREQLTGEAVIFQVTSGKLSAESPVWRGNPLMTPSFEGRLTAEERLALVKNPRVPLGGSPVDTLFAPSVIRMLVLFAYSAVLAGLWFGLPRLIWPDRYIPKPALRPQTARAPQRPSPGRPPAPPARSPGGGRQPDVTIPSPRAPGAGRPAQGAGDRGRDVPPPARGREPSPPAPPRPREPWAGREAGDATVFIPPSKKPGGSA
jgi:hypothetical protein